MIAATFHSPMYSPPNNDESSIEVFPTLKDVIEALFSRYTSNGKYEQHYTTLDGKEHDAAFPNVEAGTYLTCYLTDGDHPDRIFTEDGVMEVLSAVHGGHWDYTVSLVESEQGSLVCQVERAGI